MRGDRSGPSSVFCRTYRRLLVLYPRAFRDRFTPEMLELLDLRRARAMQAGVVSRWLFPVVALRDLAAAAWREHRRSSLAEPASGRSLAAMTIDDLRAASRRLRRSRAMTLTIVGLLALAIGSATVVFSVVNAMLLRPLPYADPDRIVAVWEANDHNNRNTVGAHEFPVWARRNQSFDAMAAVIYADGIHLNGAGEPVSLLGVRVSAPFFRVMGVAPAIGRAFTNEEDTEGHGDVVILSDRLWRSRFGSDRSVVGREIRLDGRTVSVIGVMPPGFAFPAGMNRALPDLWSPIAEPIERYRGRHYLYVVGRMKPGVTVMQAQGDLSAIAASIATALPEFSLGHGVNVVSLHADLVRDARTSLLLLLGAVACLLLIGCSNVAGLLLARGLARRRELSLELALGATRVRLARQLLLESLVLSLAGGAIGLAIASAITRLVPALVPPDVARLDAIQIDRTVFGFALGISILTGLFFGMAPSLQMRSFGMADMLRRGGRSLIGADHPRLRRALVSAQVALAVLLVLGAGLMMRGLVAVQHINPGFDTDRTLTVDLALRGSRYSTPIAQRDFFGALRERLSAIPGVVSIGAADSVPLSGASGDIMIGIEGRPDPPTGQEPGARFRVISAGFFKALGAPLKAGREFTSTDARLAVPLIRWYPQQPFPPMFGRPQAAPVAIVNESMAKTFWPGESPLGRRFQALLSPPLTIVGVVADTHTVALREQTGPEFYLSDLQEPRSDMGLLIRSTITPENLTPAVRSVLQQIDPALPVTSIGTMDLLRGRELNQPRFMTTLLGAFALMALMLMTAGIYGLLAFTAAQRLPEMGVRVALGAPRRQIHSLILRDALGMTTIGVVIGLAAAVVLGRVLTDQFFGIAPTDRLTYVVVTLLVLVVVTIACWLPARRAARVDPMVVLKQE